jgi:hypothetical protein
MDYEACHRWYPGATQEGVTKDAAGGRRQGDTSPTNISICIIY